MHRYQPSLTLSNDDKRKQFMKMIVNAPNFDFGACYTEIWYEVFNLFGGLYANQNSAVISNLKFLYLADDGYCNICDWRVDINNTPSEEYAKAIAYIDRVYGSLFNWQVSILFADYQFANMVAKAIDHIANTSSPKNAELIQFLIWLDSGKIAEYADCRTECETLGMKAYNQENIAQNFQFRNFKVRTYGNGRIDIKGLTAQNYGRFAEMLRLVKIKPQRVQ